MEPLAYNWYQTWDSFYIEIPVPYREKIAVTFNIKLFCVQILTDKTHDTIPLPILEGYLLNEIYPFESTWSRIDPNILVIKLIKKNNNIWWDRLFQSDPDNVPVKF